MFENCCWEIVFAIVQLCDMTDPWNYFRELQAKFNGLEIWNNY